MTRLSEHFTLDELVPTGTAESAVPMDVAFHLAKLATTLLEPVRGRFGLPVRVHSGWRPPARNAAAGGVKASDHLTGRAADFHVVDGNGQTWEANTIAAFEYLRTDMAGAFGQLILEDHRVFLANPGKLWVHVAIPSPKHPGDGTDPNAVLLSSRPGHYEAFRESRA